MGPGSALAPDSASALPGTRLSGTTWSELSLRNDFPIRFSKKPFRDIETAHSARKRSDLFETVIPGRECNERTRNLEIPGSMLRIAPE
jgi:hypothetical protein